MGYYIDTISHAWAPPVSPLGFGYRLLQTNVNALRVVWLDERGQGLPEYALLIAAIVVVVVIATVIFAESVHSLWNDIGTYIQTNGRVRRDDSGWRAVDWM